MDNVQRDNLDDKDMKELPNKIDNANGGHSAGQQSRGESTPPRLFTQSPLQDHDGNDDDDSSGHDWLPSALRSNGGGKGRDNEGGGDDGDEPRGTTIRNAGGDRDDYNTTGEFTLVNSRNIDMKKFTGDSNCKLTYMEFNENQREVVNIKGTQGEVLKHILTWVEERGDKPITNIELAKLERLVPKIWEYIRAVHVALKGWKEGVANKLIKYGIDGGIDAWRRLYAEYIPLSQTKQDIILSETLELKPVNDKTSANY